MDNNKPQATPAIAAKPQQQANDANAVSWREIWHISLKVWYWYLISAILCVAIATAYLLRVPKSYTRSASIMIKQDKAGKSIGNDVASAFSDMGLGRSMANVDNELLVLQSNDEALAVTKRMNFNVSYTVSGLFHPEKIYGTTLPVKVEFPDADDNTVISFDLTINGDDAYTVTNLMRDGEEYKGEMKGKLGYNVLHTTAGSIVVLKSSNFNTENTVMVNYIAFAYNHCFGIIGMQTVNCYISVHQLSCSVL